MLECPAVEGVRNDTECKGVASVRGYYHGGDVTGGLLEIRRSCRIHQLEGLPVGILLNQ